MQQKVAIKLANGIMVPAPGNYADIGYSMSFISNMMAYGFMPSGRLADALGHLDLDQLGSLSEDVMPVLKEMVGANVIHKPFYPNFPKQVMEADDQELFFNAQVHYFSTGQWLPDFTIANRPVAYESVKWKILDLVTDEDIADVVGKIIGSADSISGFSKEVVEWAVTSGVAINMPDLIPFKENVCLVAGIFLNNGVWDSKLVKDTTDILRIATYLSGGDISLAENTKFKSLPRKVRRQLVIDLERVAREEDFARHAGKWVKLLHNLHVGEYSQKLYDIAKKLRENEKIATFNGKFEAALNRKDVNTAIALASTRPGIFARNLARMVEMGGRSNKVVDAFAEVVDQVPARNLIQLWGSLKTRVDDVDKRVIFPKGLVQKAYVLRNTLARLPATKVNRLIDIIGKSLQARFAEKDELGNVYIDPALYECPLPTAMRSASEGLREVARGTRMDIGNKDVLRFFIYWKGRDIDLSASLHDENFNLVEDIAYYNLRGSFGCHSGDITNAPHGASEFIDINIAQAAKKGRYVAMHVMVFSGPTFAEHDECFAGWMTRDKVNSNEIYEPKTVEQKIDVRSATKNVIPVMFDLVERKAIWTDISTNGKGFGHGSKYNMRGGNNVQNNKATIEDMVEAFTSLDNKVTLGELFEQHAKARGNIVADRADADFVFGMDDEANITPYNVVDINADYL